MILAKKVACSDVNKCEILMQLPSVANDKVSKIMISIIKETKKKSTKKKNKRINWLNSQLKQARMRQNFVQIPIDHIFVSKDIKVNNFEVIKNIGSDHNPILSILNI